MHFCYAAQFPDKQTIIDNIIFENPNDHNTHTMKEVFEALGVSENKVISLLSKIEKDGFAPNKEFVESIKKNEGWI